MDIHVVYSCLKLHCIQVWMTSNLHQKPDDCINKWNTPFQNYATLQKVSDWVILWSDKIYFDSYPEVLGLCIFRLVHRFTSILVSSIIKSVRVPHKIFRSCFLCAVAQLAHFLGNDIIKALASDVIVADFYTVKCRCSPVCCHRFLKDVLF